MPTCVILNPGAGGREDPDVLERLLREELPDTEVRRTGDAGDARALARAAVDDGFDRVVAGGGDGTIHEVLNGLAPDFDAATFGILPLGTANDLARSLDIGPGAPEAIVALRENRVTSVDLIEVRRPARDGNSSTSGGEDGPDDDGTVLRYALNTAVGGFGGRVGEDLEPEEKRQWGTLAYLKSAIEDLGDLPQFDCRVGLDENVAERRLLNLVVANGRFTGGRLAVAPDARVDDGELDVVLLAAVGLGKLAGVATALAAGRAARNDAVEAFRARRIVVESDPAMRFRCDGEELASAPLEFRVRPGRLRVVVGPAPEAVSNLGGE